MVQTVWLTHTVNSQA